MVKGGGKLVDHVAVRPWRGEELDQWGGGGGGGGGGGELPLHRCKLWCSKYDM